MSKSKDAAKIRAKYPGHFPVICTSSDGTTKRKLLVPASMTCTEFEQVARERCVWACAESSVQILGKTISDTCSVRDLYDKHKAADDFLYVTVTSGGSGAKMEEATETAPEPERAAATAAAENVPAEPANPSAPCVFHMPDNDGEAPPQAETASEEAKRVRKVMNKYPDRVPVLVKQAASPGLPHIDRKLLVPKVMTASGLKGILPKHLAIPEDVSVKWNFLRLFMGEEPLPDDAAIEDVYKQYVDEGDGGLHITLKIDGAEEAQGAGEHEDAQAAYARQLKEALEAAQDDAHAAKQAAACAEERAVAAEQKAAYLAEKLAPVEAKLAHLGQAYLSETEKTSQLQAALDSTEAKLAAAEQHDELQKTMQAEIQALRNEVKAKDEENHAMQVRILEVQQSAATKGTDLEKTLEDAKEMLKLETEKSAAMQKALNCVWQEKVGLEAAQKVLEQKNSEEAKRNLQVMTQELEAMTAEKKEAQEKAAKLEERLTAMEELEAKRQEAQRAQADREQEAQRAQAARERERQKKQELEAEGFVHLGWDQATGWATELEAEDQEFEVLMP